MAESNWCCGKKGDRVKVTENAGRGCMSGDREERSRGRKYGNFRWAGQGKAY